MGDRSGRPGFLFLKDQRWFTEQGVVAALASESVFQAEKSLCGEGAWFRGGLRADRFFLG